MNAFGDKLKQLREAKGWTVNQLAMYSGVSGASISRYETGKRKPPKPPTIKKLANALKSTDAYFELMEAAGYIQRKAFTNDQARNDAMELYNRLPQDKQKIVDEVIRGLFGDNQK